MFSDDFKSKRLDASKWFPGLWYAVGNPPTSSDKLFTAFTPAQAYLTGSLLHLRAESRPTYDNESKRTYPDVAGLVSTGPATWLGRRATFAFRFGYAEVRMRCPAGAGLWSSFWLTSTGQRRPEIDVAELLGRDPEQVRFSYHEWPGDEPHATKIYAPGIDYCGAGFHTYAVDWRPDGIDLWVDGRKTGLSFPNPSTQPMYVVLSLAAGGGWAGTPDLASLPAELTVDFVRVWQRRGSN